MRSTIHLLTVLMTVLGIISCASEAEIYLINSGLQYSKPQDSTESLKGRRVDYQVWFNKSKWRILNPDSDIYRKLQKETGNMSEAFGDILVHESDNVLALTLENSNSTPLKSAARNYNNWTYAKGDQLISQELRTINNNEVLFIKSYGRNDGIKSIKLYYYLTNKAGTVVVYVYTTQQLFTKYESDIFDLLNGLADTNSTRGNSKK